MSDISIRKFVDVYDKVGEWFRGDQGYLYVILRNASNSFQSLVKGGEAVIAVLLLLYTTDGMVYMHPIYPEDKVKTVAAELQQFCVPLWGYSLQRVYDSGPQIIMAEPVTIC